MTQANFTTKIDVSNPEKIGDGLNAYVRYTLKVHTDNAKFKGETFEVGRRFREFHALYETLVDIYRIKGVHIAHPPEKSITANTRVKIASESVANVVQIEQRRVSLEHFINRIASHPILGNDENVINFLTQAVCTAKPRDTLIKLASNINSTFQKLIPEIEEYDQWFEEKFGKIINLESVLNTLHDATSDLHNLRRGLVAEYKKFSAVAIELRGTESSNFISKAITALAELKEKASIIMEKQCVNELHELVGSTRNVLDDIISIKHLLTQYTKSYNSYKALESKLQSKKEQLIKFEASPDKREKIPALKFEIDEIEKKVTFSNTQLEEFYSSMKSEVNYFEEVRVRETRISMVRYFKEWKVVQTELIDLWESTLPICQAIQ